MSIYSDASLIFYPSGYEAGKLYSLKPTDGSGDLTFTRASTATRVNESGLIESVAANVPRLDNSQGGCSTLLLEPQRTNLLTYSNTYNLGSWIASSITVLSNFATSPDGTTNATKIYPTSSGNFRHIRNNLANPYSGTASIFIYAKASGLSNLSLLDYDGSGVGINFNLSTGVATSYATTAFINFDMVSVGDGWYRCSATALNPYYYFNITDGGSSVGVTANGTDGVLIAFSQLEAGTYPTSYIPTSGVAVTRVKDDLSLTSASVSTIAPTSGFTLFMDFYLSQDQETSRFSLFDNAYQNYVYLGSQDRPTNQSIRCEIRGSSVRFINYEPPFMDTGRHKMAVKFLTSGIKVYLDGVEVASSGANAGLSASFQNIVVGRDYPPTVGAIARSITESFMIFPSALSDEDLAALTTL